ncbi:MAG: hypothetical protein PUC53_01790 [Bacteroidales bacterium]|nr:hypothetical protein [Bacteroidales bacterium]
MCDVCKGINSHLCPICGKEPDMVECPECAGKGAIAWWAIDRRTGDELEVSEATYACLPPTERLAETKGEWYYQGEVEKCENCDGTGEVVDDRGPEDFFDEDAYMEARYERNYARL